MAKDTSPRFYLQLRPTAVGGKGEQVKVSAETESERLEWITAIMKLKEQVPKEEEEDDPYRACCGGAARAAGLYCGWLWRRQRVVRRAVCCAVGRELLLQPSQARRALPRVAPRCHNKNHNDNYP